jgi:TPP-dependent pyruvate/acetoin dehydrogenase alpha subunit
MQNNIAVIEKNDNSLGTLTDPCSHQDDVDISGYSKEMLFELLRTMHIIRKAEEKIGDMVTAGKIKCPCHLAIGQEAIATGISHFLRNTDKVLGAHRSHTHFLALNRNVHSLFAEVLGKVTGCSKGMGGSMHLQDPASGFIGSVPIVGATVPIATGAALAAKLDGKKDIAVSYFGDGSTEEGAVQEAFNLASVMKLPIVFVCENNLFSSHLHISLRQPSNSIARYAKAHCIPYEIVDGNDIGAMLKASERAVNHTRNNNGPYFLETVTYRWRGHVGPREDVDVGVKRNVDLVEWKKRGPIKRLTNSLIKDKLVTRAEIKELENEIDILINKSWEQAEKDPYPKQSKLLEWVYSDGN